MAVEGAYLYTGSYDSGENVDLSGPRRVDVKRKGSAVKDALNQGTVVISVPMTSARWSVVCDAIVKVYDRDGNVYSTQKTLGFSRNPTVQTFSVPVPLDEGFDILNITHFTIEDAVPRRQNLFITPDECTLEAKYVLPSKVGEPTAVWCTPDSLAEGRSVLHWSGMVDGDYNPITGYVVYRSNTETGSYTKISGDDPIPAGVTSMWVDSRPGRDKAYYYRVQVLGLRKGFDSARSEAFGVLTTEWTEPEAPTGLALTSVLVKPGESVILSWNPSVPGTNNPAYQYEVYRQADVDDYELIATLRSTWLTVDPPPSNAVAYRFKVRGIGVVEGFDSPLSAASVDLRSTFTAPSTPQGLRINSHQNVYLDAGETATLTWSASDDGQDNPVQGYRIFANGNVVGDTVGTSYTIAASQTAGETLRITVRAVGLWSMSQPSNMVELTTTLPPVPPRSNDAITQFLHFDRNDQLLFVRDDAISMRVVEEEYRLNGAYPYHTDKPIERGTRIGWLEGDELRMYEIRQPETDVNAMVQTFEAEHAAIAELSDAVIEAKTFSQVSPVDVVTYLLRGTGWQLGHVTADTEPGDVELEYSTAWSALVAVRDAWSIEVVPRMAYTYDGIERYIDLLDRRGENRGVRLTLDMNVQKAGIIYDDRSLYTALYGLGSNIQETDAAGNKTSRRLTFNGVAWSVEDGKPVNKPLGQRFVEDHEATVLYGRHQKARYGVMTFDGITNQHILLQATWDALQQLKKPRFTVSLTAFDLSTIGYAAQGIALGDDVVVILDPIGVEVMARVTRFDRDVLHPENSRPTIGDVRESILGKIAAASKQQIAVGSGYTLDVDRTLSIDGLAADAKTTGDMLALKLANNLGAPMAGRYLKVGLEGEVIAAAEKVAIRPPILTSLPDLTVDDIGRMIIWKKSNPTSYTLMIGLMDAYGDLTWGIVSNINF